MENLNRLVYPNREIWEALPTIAERLANGKKQRNHTAREAHATPTPGQGRLDPVQLLIDSSVGRIQEFVPIRYGRMLQNSFAFLRGGAAIMARDLSAVPSSGIYVQCCGDCHLMNFGGYATPERNQVFDINDFDETLPAPFEWDVKRLAASIIVAGRYRGFSDKDSRKAAVAAISMYTRKMREFVGMRQLEVWYNRLDEATIINLFKDDTEFVRRVKNITDKARIKTHENVFPRISELVEGRRRIVDAPPLIVHPPESEQLIQRAYNFFNEYYRSMSDDKKSLLSRYRFEDAALKVVGVGSVGTRCLIGLMVNHDDDALILQFKEGNASVLEPYAGKSVYANHGERIVNGQRLMQTVSDIFLGWTKTSKGVEFYVRQLRDMKASANLDNATPRLLGEYAALCGWALAKSHAKAGRAPEISGYIGKSDLFARIVADYAVLYADLTEHDFKLLQKAEKEKRIPVIHEV